MEWRPGGRIARRKTLQRSLGNLVFEAALDPKAHHGLPDAFVHNDSETGAGRALRGVFARDSELQPENFRANPYRLVGDLGCVFGFPKDIDDIDALRDI